MIYRFNAIPVKTPMALFVEKNSKIHMKSQGIQRAKTILKTENKTGGLTFPDFKTYYKVTVRQPGTGIKRDVVIVLVAKSCQTFVTPVDCRPPSSSNVKWCNH